MKTSFVSAVVLLAGAGLAAPVHEERATAQASSNVFSDIFDGASCLVSTFLGGNKPLCFGRSDGSNLKGSSSSSSSSSSDDGDDSSDDSDSDSDSSDNAYSYNYTTNSDGTYKIVITPDDKDKDSCTYNLSSDGKSVEDLVDEAANKCLD